MERRAKVELFEQIRREYEFGIGSVKGVARKLGVHRRMVRQALASAAPPERKRTGAKRPLKKIAPRYVERLSRLAFAAPRIVEAICQGRQPADLNAQTLLIRIDLPLEWSAQIDALGVDWSRSARISELR